MTTLATVSKPPRRTSTRSSKRRPRQVSSQAALSPLEASAADRPAAYFKDEQHVSTLLADHEKRDAVIGQMVSYATKDHNTAVTEVSYGEALHNILALPLEAQKAVVWAIADRNGVPRPEYVDTPRTRGRQPTGRKQLAEAQYGLWPDMLAPEGNNKDTRAGMQITDHVRRYRIKAGLIEHRETRSESGIPRRTLKRALEALWDFLKNKQERQMLVTLYERAGFEHEEVEEWIEEFKAAA